MNKHLQAGFLALALALGTAASGQNIRVEDLTKLGEKQKIGLSGGVSASLSAYDSNEESSARQPFVWQLNGNLNVSILELIDLPLSFNLNNYGAQYSYPSLPNRFSLHPSYKWATAHLGDVSMSFSPYTLSGHLFTGAGVDLTPGRWAVSAMGGRLQRRVDYDPALPGVLPAYGRFGGGAKVRYNGERFFLGGTVFSAKDRFEGDPFQADSLGVFPQENIAFSIEGGVTVAKNLRLSGEYALSRMIRDTRQDDAQTYDALKASLDYTFFKNTIGLGYERISPQYRTLGAYYFNNDYENVTLSYSRPFLKDKGNVALNGGMQRDDLDGTKQSRNTRLVGSVNVSYAPTEAVNLSLSGSTFQGYRVLKSQFDYINQTTPYENLDTLNFTQISQNVDFNLSWALHRGARAEHNLTFFTSYQEAADKQGAYILPGNLNRFVNASTIYAVNLTQIGTLFSLGVNYSNNYSNQSDFSTFGPLFSVNTNLLKKALTTGLSLSYNRSLRESTLAGEVYNCRWNAAWRLLKKHVVQADLVFQQRKRVTEPAVPPVRSLTAQLRYSYSFSTQKQPNRTRQNP